MVSSEKGRRGLESSQRKRLPTWPVDRRHLVSHRRLAMPARAVVPAKAQRDSCGIDPSRSPASEGEKGEGCARTLVAMVGAVATCAVGTAGVAGSCTKAKASDGDSRDREKVCNVSSRGEEKVRDVSSRGEGKVNDSNDCVEVLASVESGRAVAELVTPARSEEGGGKTREVPPGVRLSRIRRLPNWRRRSRRWA